MGKQDIEWLASATEAELKTFLEDSLSPLFRIEKEVPGNFLIDNTPVIIDYLLYPGDEALNLGFPAGWFGVEVKSAIQPKTGNKLSRVAWQSITYGQSSFGEYGRPMFVLIFPAPIWFVHPDDGPLAIKHLLPTLQHGNVGFLDIKKTFWSIKFGCDCLFDSKKGLRKHATLGQKRNVGNF